MSPRRYALTLAALLGAALLGLAVFSVYLQPLEGDLTRVGWYAEREHGWQAPQRRFARPLYDFGPYVRPVDVVVIGDSFSRGRPAVQWQNYFVERTGLSLLTLDTHVDDFNLEAFVHNGVFETHPPKLVVVETAERELVNTLGRGSAACDLQAGASTSPRLAPTQPAPADGRLETFERATGVDAALDPGYGKMFLLKSLLARWLPFTARAYELKLDSPRFSSRNADGLLVFYKDFDKRGWTPRQIQNVRCRLAEIRARVEASGRTRFVFLLAPDKVTAYGDLVARGQGLPPSRIEDILGDAVVPGPRVDLALRPLVHSAETDVYLPDDTHWGWLGHKAAATALANYLAS